MKTNIDKDKWECPYCESKKYSTRSETPKEIEWQCANCRRMSYYIKENNDGEKK